MIKKQLMFVILTLSLTFIKANALAQQSDPAWLDDLTQQLALEEACDVAYYILVNEKKTNGFWTYKARAQCVDGRQFDASLREPEEKFTIEKCKITVCFDDKQRK